MKRYTIKRNHTFIDKTDNQLYSVYRLTYKYLQFTYKRYFYIHIQNYHYSIFFDFNKQFEDVKRQFRTIKSPFNIRVKEVELKLNEYSKSWLSDLIINKDTYTSNIVDFIDKDFDFYVENDTIIYNFEKNYTINKCIK